MERKVLLIDDEASLRRSVSLGLMQKGYQTEPCENGMKGLQALETYKKKQMALGCAVVDIRLPDIDGLKLLKVIKFNYPQLPVIIITGHGSDAIAEEAKGADAYLEKPFDMDQLTRIMEELEPKAAEATEEPTREAPVKEESVSMYAMVSLDSSAALLRIYRKLYFHRNVLYCDAIRGDYDLLLLLQAPTVDAIREVAEQEIGKMAGVAEVSLLSVETPMFGENVIHIMGSVDRAPRQGQRRERGRVPPDGQAEGFIVRHAGDRKREDRIHLSWPLLQRSGGQLRLHGWHVQHGAAHEGNELQ